MARATTKPDLIKAMHTQYEKLQQTIAKLGPENEEKAFLFEDRDKNLRDVLAHLHEWHNMVISWYTIGTIEGGKPEIPGRGYNWRTTPGLNKEIWEDYQDTTLPEIKEKLEQTHNKFLKIIESHTNEELFAKSVYSWTKSSAMGAYFVSSGPSHYDWAMKKIKKQIKLLSQQ